MTHASGDMAEPKSSELMAELRALRKEMQDVSERVGREKDTDKGSTGDGLTGRLIRVEKQVGGLLSLKRTGVGFIAGAFLVVCILLFGIKGTIAAFLGGHG